MAAKRINHFGGGNMGGPLINLNGDTIGVNTWIIASNEQKLSHGLGFAIPLYQALKALRGADGALARTRAVAARGAAYHRISRRRASGEDCR